MLYLTTYAGLILLRFAKAQNLYYVVLISLFLFSAFRFKVGCDWSGYLNQFYLYRAVPFSEIFQEREPLWIGLFTLQSWFGLPYPWINVFSSVIFFWGVHVLGRRQLDPLAFLILLFPILIINIPMSGIRQAAATGVLCMAFVAFVDRRLVRFTLTTLLAAAFHSSAIVFLLLIPLVRGNYSKKRLALSGMLAAPGALALLSTKAAEVATSRYIGAGTDAAGAAFRVALLVVTAVFFFLFLRKKWAAAFPQDYKLVAIGSFMMMAMMVLVPISSVIGDRLGYYLIPIQTMIFARLPYLPLLPNRQLFVALPYLGLMLVFAVWTTLSTLFPRCYEPYDTWLFGFPEG
ncbi:MAG: EpsG family protein [Methylocystis sp.]